MRRLVAISNNTSKAVLAIVALAIALTSMLRDGEVSRPRASELARMVLADNARKLYDLR